MKTPRRAHPCLVQQTCSVGNTMIAVAVNLTLPTALIRQLLPVQMMDGERRLSQYWGRQGHLVVAPQRGVGGQLEKAYLGQETSIPCAAMVGPGAGCTASAPPPTLPPPHWPC